jgi:hypothetical protein
MEWLVVLNTGSCVLFLKLRFDCPWNHKMLLRGISVIPICVCIMWHPHAFHDNCFRSGI